MKPSVADTTSLPAPVGMAPALWGRTTTIQTDVLRLCGVIPEAGDESQLRSAVRAMKDGLLGLRTTTGQDFGFDLRAWDSFLLQSEFAPAYTHAATWIEVRTIVETAINSSVRTELVRQFAPVGGLGARWSVQQ